MAAFLFVRVHLPVALLSFHMQVSLQQFPVMASYAISDLLYNIGAFGNMRSAAAAFCLTAWHCSRKSKSLDKTHGSTEIQVTDYNFQGICQAIRRIQINHHAYYFQLETKHIISKRWKGQGSKLLHRHWPASAFSALLGCSYLKNTSNESSCVWLMINHDLVSSIQASLLPTASCV